MIQQTMAAILVIGLMTGGLWLARSRGLLHYRGPAGRKSGKPLEPLARLALTAHHSVHLVRVSDHAVLLAVSPSGCTLVERLDAPGGTLADVPQTCAGAAQ